MPVKPSTATSRLSRDSRSQCESKSRQLIVALFEGSRALADAIFGSVRARSSLLTLCVCPFSTACAVRLQKHRQNECDEDSASGNDAETEYGKTDRTKAMG
jgi:hypothetical protein